MSKIVPLPKKLDRLSLIMKKYQGHGIKVEQKRPTCPIDTDQPIVKGIKEPWKCVCSLLNSISRKRSCILSKGKFLKSKLK